MLNRVLCFAFFFPHFSCLSLDDKLKLSRLHASQVETTFDGKVHWNYVGIVDSDVNQSSPILRKEDHGGKHRKTIEPDGVPIVQPEGGEEKEEKTVMATTYTSNEGLVFSSDHVAATSDPTSANSMSMNPSPIFSPNGERNERPPIHDGLRFPGMHWLSAVATDSSTLQINSNKLWSFLAEVNASVLLGACFMLLSLVASLCSLLWLIRSSSAMEDVTSQEPPDGTVTSVAQIWGLTSVNLAYGFMVCAVAIFILPKEAQQMFPEHRGIVLGSYEALVACSMVFGPVAGRISDSLKHPLGRRRPMIHLSLHAAAAFTAGMWVSSALGFKVLFFMLLPLQQIMWNSANAAQTALLSDLVEPSKKDVSAAIQVASLLMGSIAAIAVFQCSILLDFHFEYNYMITMLLGWMMLPVLHISATEVRSDHLSLPPQLEWWQPAASFRAVFYLGADRSPGFTWLTIERGAYYAGVAAKAFIFFFLKDGLGITDNKEQAMFMSDVAYASAISATLSGLVTSVIFSVTTLRSRSLAASGAFCMALSSQFWVCTVSNHIMVRKLCMILCIIGYGLGQGCYLSADLALTMATIPDPNEASRYMGFWGVSAFIGGGLGSVAAGALMEVFGKLLPEHLGIHVASGSYHIAGYMALLIGTLLCNLTTGIICLRIRTRAEHANPQDAIQLEPNPQDES